MRCMLCESLSLQHICKHCQKTFLTPQIYKRQLNAQTQVISFYKYEDIKEFLHTKHTDIGFYIYNILAKNSFKKFAQEFTMQDDIVSVAIDDHTKSAYSHTAILNKNLHSNNIKALFNVLRAQNRVSYSGESREFRLKNPRNFSLQNFKETNVILVDDIITTGSTLSQALNSMLCQDKKVLFCLTLTDVQVK